MIIAAVGRTVIIEAVGRAWRPVQFTDSAA
jgi:hypothetical protein